MTAVPGVLCIQRLKVKNKKSSSSNKKNGRVIFSASRDGSLALWEESSGKLLQKHSIRHDDDMAEDAKLRESRAFSGNAVTIASAHAWGDYVYLGLTAAGNGGDQNINGNVWIYSLQNLQFRRVGQWTAYSDASSYVTAIHCAGPSISSSSTSTATSTSFTVVTGSSNGELKQWLVMERQRPPPQDQGQNDDKSNTPKIMVDVWPKLVTQRLPKMAHVFRSGDGGGGASSRQSSAAAITCIQVHGNHDWSSSTTTSAAAAAAAAANDRSSTAPLILSACANGTVQCWNSMTGRRVFFMDGFTSPLHSLCVYKRTNNVVNDDDDDSAAADNDNLLITDGMKHLVCVHDFGQSIAQQRAANDDLDDDFDVDDYLIRF
jgi:WD40 repeat protein